MIYFIFFFFLLPLSLLLDLLFAVQKEDMLAGGSALPDKQNTKIIEPSCFLSEKLFLIFRGVAFFGVKKGELGVRISNYSEKLHAAYNFLSDMYVICKVMPVEMVYLYDEASYKLLIF